MSKLRISLALIPPTLALAIVGIALAAPSVGQSKASILEKVAFLVSQSFVDSIPPDTLSLLAAEGIVAGLRDPYSVVMTPKELGQLNRSIGGAYGGLGVQIEGTDTEETSAARLVRIFPGSPAQSAGLAPGDMIAKINGQPTRGWPLDKIIDLLTGPLNTTVKLAIERPGLDSLINVRVIRREISAPTIPFTLVVHDSIGYLPLTSFGEGTTGEVTNAIGSLIRQGATKLVLDLRSNPGGRLEESIQLAELFLPIGAHVASVESRRNLLQQFNVERPGGLDMPVVVLVNGSTASASEILSGALQDNDRALILGQITYGKGLVQSIFPLAEGYALKLTTGRWKTPSGRSIQRPRPLGLSLGQLDSLDNIYSDTAHRPIFNTSLGRRIRGGGGVVPDVFVFNDTTTIAERAALGKTPAEYARLRNWLTNFAARTPKPALLESLNNLPSPELLAQAKAGLISARIIPAVADTTLNRILPRLLGSYMASHHGGDRGSFYFELRYDRQLQESLKRLDRAPTTKILLSQSAKQ